MCDYSSAKNRKRRKKNPRKKQTKRRRNGQEYCRTNHLQRSRWTALRNARSGRGTCRLHDAALEVTAMKNEFRRHYKEHVMSALQERHGHKNAHHIPKLEKFVIST